MRGQEKRIGRVWVNGRRFFILRRGKHLILGFTIRFAHRTKAEADTQKSHILKPKAKPKTKNTDILT
jgi:hypothetical protein